MKVSLILPLVALGSSLLLAACGDGANQSVDVYADEMNRIADAVEQVETADDAREVADVIADAREKMDAATAQLDGMSDAEKAMISSSRAAEVAKAQARIAASMTSLAMRDPEALRIITAEFRKISTPR